VLATVAALVAFVRVQRSWLAPELEGAPWRNVSAARGIQARLEQFDGAQEPHLEQRLVVRAVRVHLLAKLAGEAEQVAQFLTR
jgi:hypothetical protein